MKKISTNIIEMFYEKIKIYGKGNE
jgi:hypothetical protein